MIIWLHITPQLKMLLIQCNIFIIVLMNFFHLGWQHSLQEWILFCGYKTKVPISGMRHSLLSSWSGLSKRLPKHKAYCYFLAYPLELENKFLLLRIPRTLETQHRGLWAGHTRKSPPCWLSFKVPCNISKKGGHHQQHLYNMPMNHISDHHGRITFQVQ